MYRSGLLCQILPCLILWRGVVRDLRPLFMAAVVALSCATVCAEDVAKLEVTTAQSTFFPDDQVAFELALTAPEAVDGKVTWQLTTQHRTHARGEVAIKTDPTQPSPVKFRFQMPHVKDGVIQPTVLSATFSVAGNEQAATVERELWVFSRDPYTDRKQWLESLQIQLFDPTGDSVNVLEKANVPFEDIRSITELGKTEQGIVLVTEGSKHAELAETLVSLARNGRRVLWFAPKVCDLEFPGGEENAQKRPKRLVLSGSDMIERLDKRLDAGLWANSQQANAVGFAIAAHRNRMSVEVVEPKKIKPQENDPEENNETNLGWSWLQILYEEPVVQLNDAGAQEDNSDLISHDQEGQLIICGLGLIDGWDATPTPRFLLARLLERLDNTTDSSDTPNNEDQ